MEESREHPVAAKWRRRIAILLVIGNIVGLIMLFPLFFLGYINDAWLFRGMVGSIVAFLAAFIVYKMPTRGLRYEPNRARKLAGLSFIVLGAFGELFIGFLEWAFFC